MSKDDYWEYASLFRMATGSQLAEIERLESELENLFDDSSVEELKSENAKLSYQINTLHRAINQEKSNAPHSSVPPEGWISRVINPFSL